MQQKFILIHHLDLNCCTENLFFCFKSKRKTKKHKERKDANHTKKYIFCLSLMDFWYRCY